MVTVLAVLCFRGRSKIAPYWEYCGLLEMEGMDDDIRNLSFLYHQPPRNNLGLNLMPSVAMERETKNFLPNEMFLHRNMPISHLQDMSWLQPREKVMPMFSFGHHSFHFPENPRPLAVRTPHMVQNEAKDGKPSQVDGPNNGKDAKKKPQDSTPKALKPRKPKKVPTPKNETRSRPERKNTDIVINGLDLDISVIPTPVCTCTGIPCTCYRWGMGGWQSACCTNSMSTYPLPMSTKRRGARIAGRKMSQGAFKKVLEKLAGEGYNLSNPIDLRNFWAKHGTNKFVTIR